MPVKRILFVTLSNIGDAVMTTPCLQALHASYPAASIDIVSDIRSQQLLSNYPSLGRLYVLDKRQGWLGRLALIAALRQQVYDLAVDLRTDWLLHGIRAKRKLPKVPSRTYAHLHSVEKHLLVLKPLGVPSAIPDARIWITARQREFAIALLGAWAGQRILALGLGANFEGKIWPAEQFAALVRELAAGFDVVLLVGNKEEAARAVLFARLSALPVVDACAVCDLLQTAALLEHAGLFVGNDSGLGHIASAMATPTMTVFGPGSPSRYRPWGSASGWLQSPDGSMQSLDALEVAAYIRATWPWVGRG